MMKKQITKASILFFLIFLLLSVVIENIDVLSKNMSISSVFGIVLGSCIATAFFYFASSRVYRKNDKR